MGSDPDFRNPVFVTSMVAIIIFCVLATVSPSSADSLREQLRDTTKELDAVREIVGGTDSTQDPQTSRTLLERTAELEKASLLALETSESVLDLSLRTSAMLNGLEQRLYGFEPVGEEISPKGTLGKLNDCINELAVAIRRGEGREISFYRGYCQVSQR